MKTPLLLLAILSSLFLVPVSASAQNPPTFEFKDPLVKVTGKKGASSASSSTESATTVPQMVALITGRVVFSLLSLAGILAVITLIRSGLFIAFARGDDGMVKKGQNGILWSVIGLLVAFIGYVVVSFIITRVSGAFSSESPVKETVSETVGLPTPGEGTVLAPGE